MPETYFGKLGAQAASCGICLRVVSVPGGGNRKIAARALRAEGWTWRTDTGWTCPCRSRCASLDPTLEPRNDNGRRRNRRARPWSGRFRAPSARTRKIIRARNRKEIE